MDVEFITPFAELLSIYPNAYDRIDNTHFFRNGKIDYLVTDVGNHAYNVTYNHITKRGEMVIHTARLVSRDRLIQHAKEILGEPQ